MGGHIHLPYTLALQGLARRLWVVQAGTAVSSRTRPGVPNSVNMLRWGEASDGSGSLAHARPGARHSCLIERWDYSLPDQVFVRTAVTPVQPDCA